MLGPRREGASAQLLDAELDTAHLRCGSDIRATLAAAGFGGDFLEHAYPYCQGPVTEDSDFLEQRARFLTEAFGAALPSSYEALLARCRDEESRLASAAHDYARIVAWFEPDSYDQLVLVRCLALFAATGAPRVLELVTTTDLPGNTGFIAFGHLPADTLRTLWPMRRRLGQPALELGAEAWRALTSDDPRALAVIARAGTPALPDLAPALLRHLRELPAVTTGLAMTERLVLELLGEATLTVHEAFRRLTTEREPLPWLGDLGFYHVIDRMQRAAAPVFTRSPTADGNDRTRDRLAITPLGLAVLAGERDWLTLEPPPRWVGGVRIEADAPVWRWNEAKCDPERTAAGRGA